MVYQRQGYNTNQTSRENMHSYVINTLQDHPNSTTKQIMQYLDEEYGERLTKTTVSDYLFALVRAGDLASERKKFGNIYRIKEADYS